MSFFSYNKTYYGYDVEVGVDLYNNCVVAFFSNDRISINAFVYPFEHEGLIPLHDLVSKALKEIREAALEYCAIHGPQHKLLNIEKAIVDERKARGNFKYFKPDQNRNGTD